MKKKWLLLMVFLFMFGLIATACLPEENDKVNKILLDGKPISFKVEPVRVNDKVYAEYSSLFKALGFQPEYDSKTNTIKANSPYRTIEISDDGMNALVDGYPVYANKDVKKINDHIMIAVEFVAINSGKKVNWDGKKKVVTITGPTPEIEAAVLNLVTKYSTSKDSKDAEALRNLFTTDTEMNVNELVHQWEKTNTKTSIIGTFIEWFSETEIIFKVKIHTERISGAFYPENDSEYIYTLHPENGEWKIYDFVLDDAQYVNPEKLFDQAIEVAPDVKSEMEALLAAQTRALNVGDIDAYASFNYYPNDTVKFNYLTLLPEIFVGISNITIEEWAVVEFTAPDQATILISKVQYIESMKGKVRKIYSLGMIKVAGQWRFMLNTEVYLSEMVSP